MQTGDESFAEMEEIVGGYALSVDRDSLLCDIRLMQKLCTETYETCERGTSRSVQKLMSEVPLLFTETCDGCERNSPLILKTYDLCSYERYTSLPLL